jgi:hypothetical protein
VRDFYVFYYLISRVTRWVREKIAQNVSQQFFCQNYVCIICIFFCGEKVAKTFVLRTSVIKNTQRKQSPNRRKFAQSCHLAYYTIVYFSIVCASLCCKFRLAHAYNALYVHVSSWVFKWYNTSVYKKSKTIRQHSFTEVIWVSYFESSESSCYTIPWTPRITYIDGLPPWGAKFYEENLFQVEVTFKLSN